MTKITYFVAQPFKVSPRGKIEPGNPQEAKSAEQADRMARGFAATKGGGLAFSRTGDTTTGDFEDAVVIGRYGHVPAEAVSS